MSLHLRLDIPWTTMSGVKISDHDNERVPVFVLFVVKDEDNGGYSDMEFYAINDFVCPVGDEHWLPYNAHTSGTLEDVPFRALPFMRINSCPLECSFVSVGDQFYLIGGSKISDHEFQQRRFESYLSFDADFDEDFLYEEDEDVDEVDMEEEEEEEEKEDYFSNRVNRFDFQNFINSLGEKQMGKCEFPVLDEVSTDSSPNWKPCSFMSKGRKLPHLLHLGCKLYAIGGNAGPTESSLIEVLDLAGQGVWTPLATKNTPDIDPYFLVSAAIEGSNTILVGSNDSFYELYVGNGEAELEWKKLDGLECSSKLVIGSYWQPGIVQSFEEDMFSVLWYDRQNARINGLNFFDKEHIKYFTVNLLLEDIFSPVAVVADDVDTSQLIDLGKRTLGLIYGGAMWYHTRDNGEENYYLREYHYVTFEIIFNKLYIESLPFPGVQLKTRVISRHKCYAPVGAEFGAAFAMDAHFPR